MVGQMELLDCKSARVESATAWRALGGLQLVDRIFNHISVAYSDGPTRSIDGFLTNSPLLLPSEATPSRMIAVGLGGFVHGDRSPNSDGLSLHLAIHCAVRSNYAAVHLHSPAISIFSATHLEMTPVTQTTMEFVGEVERIPYDGLLRDGSQCIGQTVDALLNGRIAVLQNHGVVIGGRNVAEVVYLAYYFDEACRHIIELSRLDPSSVTFPRSDAANNAKMRLVEDRRLAAQAFYAATCRTYGSVIGDRGED